MRMRLGKIAREILVTPRIDLISNDDGGLHALIISSKDNCGLMGLFWHYPQTAHCRFQGS